MKFIVFLMLILSFSSSLIHPSSSAGTATDLLLAAIIALLYDISEKLGKKD